MMTKRTGSLLGNIAASGSIQRRRMCTMDRNRCWTARCSFDGVRVPRFLYGTAWKEDATQRLAELALRQGFRGIDTANQRRHYNEAAVGRAIAAAIASGIVSAGRAVPANEVHVPRRSGSSLAVRSGGADRNASRAIVRQLACDILGWRRSTPICCTGPAQRAGWRSADWAAWRAMEAIHDSGRTSLARREQCFARAASGAVREARVRPRFVQNRCFAATGWDRSVREFCAANDIGLPGVFAADRQRQGAGASGNGPNRAAARSVRQRRLCSGSLWRSGWYR